MIETPDVSMVEYRVILSHVIHAKTYLLTLPVLDCVYDFKALNQAIDILENAHWDTIASL